MKHAYAGVLAASFAFIIGMTAWLLYIVFTTAPLLLAGIALLVAIGVAAGTIDWYTEERRKEQADGPDEEPPAPG